MSFPLDRFWCHVPGTGARCLQPRRPELKVLRNLWLVGQLLCLSAPDAGQIFRQDESWMSSVWIQNHRRAGDVEGQVSQAFGLV